MSASKKRSRSQKPPRSVAAANEIDPSSLVPRKNASKAAPLKPVAVSGLADARRDSVEPPPPLARTASKAGKKPIPIGQKLRAQRRQKRK